MTLMENVRGQDKTLGEFRHSQNWIGPANCALKDARYIPPNVEDMQNAMSDLEKFINENGAGIACQTGHLYILFFEKNQIEYYDRISEVRRSGNFEQWIRFFLEAVSRAASDSL